MALFGTITRLHAQVAQLPKFDLAFGYAEDLLRAESAAASRVRALAPGERHRTELGGGVFVSEECYLTKTRSEGFFESHRKFIDLQIMLDGVELMEVADLDRMRIRQAYNPERDLIIFEDTADASIIRVGAGEGAVFFPTDVHMPTLSAAVSGLPVRKCVVKIPVA